MFGRSFFTVERDAVNKPVPGLSLGLVRANRSGVCHDHGIVATNPDGGICGGDIDRWSNGNLCGDRTHEENEHRYQGNATRLGDDAPSWVTASPGETTPTPS